MILNKMKQQAIVAIILAAAFYAASLSANPKETTENLKYIPYFGVDQQINRTRFKHGYGDNLFPKHHAQLNLYSGLKLDEYCIALEAGYLSTISKSRFVTINSGQSILGTIVNPYVEPVVLKSYIKFKGYHLGVVSFLSLPEWDRFRIASGVGVILLKANAQRNCLSMAYPPISGTVREFKKQQPVLRIMISPEYTFKNRLGIRSSICFLNTSAMKITASPLESTLGSRVSTFNPTIRLKDNFVYSLGLFYEF